MYYIGHFIYNQETDELYKYELHDPTKFDFYQSEMLMAEVKRNNTLHKDIMTDEDRAYCRGRVFEYRHIGLVIVVGTWIHEYPKVIDKVKELFKLPKDTVIIVHKHWNIENNRDFL